MPINYGFVSAGTYTVDVRVKDSFPIHVHETYWIIYEALALVGIILEK